MTLRKDGIRLDRLEKLRKYLMKLPEKKFNFSMVINSTNHISNGKTQECGSIGCAIGHTPNIFPKLVKYSFHPDKSPYDVSMKKGKSSGYVRVASKLFGISSSIAMSLFSPEGEIDGVTLGLYEDATPKEVARNINSFIKAIKAGKKITDDTCLY